jgi:hypothetical protein
MTEFLHNAMMSAGGAGKATAARAAAAMQFVESLPKLDDASKHLFNFLGSGTMGNGHGCMLFNHFEDMHAEASNESEHSELDTAATDDQLNEAAYDAHDGPLVDDFVAYVAQQWGVRSDHISADCHVLSEPLETIVTDEVSDVETHVTTPTKHAIAAAADVVSDLAVCVAGGDHNVDHNKICCVDANEDDAFLLDEESQDEDDAFFLDEENQEDSYEPACTVDRLAMCLQMPRVPDIEPRKQKKRPRVVLRPYRSRSTEMLQTRLCDVEQTLDRSKRRLHKLQNQYNRLESEVQYRILDGKMTSPKNTASVVS